MTSFRQISVGVLAPAAVLTCMSVGVGPLSGASSRSELDEAGRREVAVERKRATYLQVAHDREAGCVDERALTLIARAQPTERPRLLRLGGPMQSHPGRSIHGVEERYGGAMAGAAAQIGPGLAADVVADNQSGVLVLAHYLTSYSVRSKKEWKGLKQS